MNEALKAEAEAIVNLRDERDRTTDPHILISRLLSALTIADAALDAIAGRCGSDAYDDPSSSLESIGDSIEATGRKVEHE